MVPKPIIAPSILSADFALLAAEAKRMEEAGAHYLHIDVMDGHFVPNLTLGAPVVKSLRKHTKMFLDCHLMVTHPRRWIDDFVDAGADMFTFHVECMNGESDVRSLIEEVKSKGLKVGLAIKPNTSVEHILPFCGEIDMALIMTVEPGFGGQKLIESCLAKATTIRKAYPNLDIEVDGGVGVDNIEVVAKAGFNVIVSGTGIFKHKDPKEAISTMIKSIECQ